MRMQVLGLGGVASFFLPIRVLMVMDVAVLWVWVGVLGTF